MQVLFCHDGPLKVDVSGNYYGTAHNDKTFKRYYGIADKVAVLMRLNRIKKEESIKNLSQISLSPFKVYELPNTSNVKGIVAKRRKAKSIVKNAVIESDYVVARLPSMAGFMAINYAKKYNKPYLTEVVACPWDAYWNHSLKGKIVAPFMYLATKKLARGSNYVIYVTNQFLQRRYPTKGKSVNCSNVALTKFDDNILKKRLDKIKNTTKGHKIIIGTTAAVNVRYKGQQYVINALGDLKKQGYTNFEYQLVGTGDQSFLKSEAQKCDVINQIKFLGPMVHNEVFDWLETIDIYAQPSRQEGLPRALIEAMSRGLPAFGANTAGIPELLEREFVFSNNKNNIKQICSILLKFDEEKLLSQAKRNFEESMNYDSDIIDKRRNEFFKDFAGK
ncbi:glycosyltransferase family 4 protein [Natribacillus halophilus]|uniref:Glycosyltransferase involved in cell wall bisynthesis n=1 Tax=Natribacillus halophilus TaxID=549003 RepID=A0A1G8KFI1_9BACI|nr:glycosyltransferase [Natribacillus halophilus]SDI42167.1 Glycosyltransferase involved in cell wall bisynthesis [Natribacillus halophilus]